MREHYINKKERKHFNVRQNIVYLILHHFVLYHTQRKFYILNLMKDVLKNQFLSEDINLSN